MCVCVVGAGGGMSVCAVGASVSVCDGSPS